MGVPIVTHRGTVTRAGDLTGDYEDDTAAPTTIASGLPVAITSPSGAQLMVGGRQEIVDAVLTAPAAPPLRAGDLFADDDSDDQWRIVWARTRRGLGLDHQTAGLRAVTGAANG